MRIGEGRLTIERHPKKVTPRADAPRGPPPSRGDEPSPFAAILASLGREVDRGEAIFKRVAHGGQELGNADLLALQISVYRYSEAVDLAAKLVDRAANGVKTVLQGQ